MHGTMKTRSRADLHMHTSCSDGWPSPSELVTHVIARTDLRVIAVTDHDTLEGALRAADRAAKTGGIEVVIGEEVSSRDGHILGLFLERRVRPGMSAAATLHAIHDQGGLAIAPHPFWRTLRRESNGGVVHGVGWLAAELEFDAIEVENATPGLRCGNRLVRRAHPRRGRAGLHGFSRPDRRRPAALARGARHGGRPVALQSGGFDALRRLGIQPPAIRRRRSLS